MQITSDKEEMIFRKDYNGKPSYSIGLSKKNKDGKFENGYMNVRFKKDVELENKSKLKIKDAWLGFNTKDDKTYPYIFINDYELIETKEENPFEQFGDSIKTESEIGQQIQISDEDLPF